MVVSPTGPAEPDKRTRAAHPLAPPYTCAMRRHVFEVPGISCGHCQTAIETEVADVSGVERVVVDVERKLVEIEGLVSAADVVAAISDAGYEVASSSP